MAPEDTRPPRPTRRAGEPVAAFSARIDQYVADVRAMQRTLPKRHTRDVVKEVVEVEKVVYRDHPAEKMLNELEDVERELKQGISDLKYKFKVPFLQAERLVNEDLAKADFRLFEEYSELELRRPLEPKDDARWRLLQGGLFDFRG